MSSESQKKAFKKYNSKRFRFAFSYSPADEREAQRLLAYLHDTGQSINAYLRDAVKRDLDAQSVPYVPRDRWISRDSAADSDSTDSGISATADSLGRPTYTA